MLEGIADGISLKEWVTESMNVRFLHEAKGVAMTIGASDSARYQQAVIDITARRLRTDYAILRDILYRQEDPSETYLLLDLLVPMLQFCYQSNPPETAHILIDAMNEGYQRLCEHYAETPA